MHINIQNEEIRQLKRLRQQFAWLFFSSVHLFNSWKHLECQVTMASCIICHHYTFLARRCVAKLDNIINNSGVKKSGLQSNNATVLFIHAPAHAGKGKWEWTIKQFFFNSLQLLIHLTCSACWFDIKKKKSKFITIEEWLWGALLEYLYINLWLFSDLKSFLLSGPYRICGIFLALIFGNNLWIPT